MGGRPSALDGEPAALAVRIDNAVHEAGLDLQATPELSYREMLDEALSVVEGDIDATATGHLADRCRLLAVLSGLREELAEHHFQRRLRTYSRVQDQLVRLRSAESVDAVVAGAPQAVCEAGDFDRSAIYRVRGSDMLAEATYIRDDPETAREYLEFSRDNPAPLQEQILESEMVRRRIPMLVPDALQHPRTFKPMVEHYQTHCYVAAPIMPEGRVIGFLHADRALRRPNDPDGMDEFDRDVLWAFAEGLGYVIERAHLVAQLRSQAAEVESLLARTRSVVTEYMDNRVQMISDPGIRRRSPAVPLRYWAGRRRRSSAS